MKSTSDNTWIDRMDAHGDGDTWSVGSGNYDQIIQDELNSDRPGKWQKKILSQVDSSQPLEILDIGCGPGFFTIVLGQLGHKMTAIDGADGMLEKAVKNIKASRVKADIFKMDCQKLDFPDNTFDLVVSRNVTHALQDHPGAYAEWKRVLKPGGVLLIFDANWHLTGLPGPLREQYKKDWAECIRRFGSDFNGHTDPDVTLESFEPESAHLLGDLLRPDWDLGILAALGYREITTERNIIKEMWDEKEQLIYGTTPMFMIRAVK